MTDSKPHIWSLTFNFRLFSRKSQSQQKLTKTMTLLQTSLILRSSKGKKYTPSTQLKTHSLYKFSSKHVSGWCQKKHLHCTSSIHPRTHSRSNWKANVSIFLYISVRKFLFQRRRKLLSGGVGVESFPEGRSLFGTFYSLEFFCSFPF